MSILSFYLYVSRRKFIEYSGGSVTALGFLFSACKKKERELVIPYRQEIDLGTGDKGILNYFYVIKQLEATFFTNIVTAIAFETIYTKSEQKYLTEIKSHDTIHRELLMDLLYPGNSLNKPSVEINLTFLDFNNRKVILNNALFIKELSIAAFNGIAAYFEKKDYLLLAAKMNSVISRHRTTLRNFPFLFKEDNKQYIYPISSDYFDINEGLDMTALPSVILPAINVFIKNKIIGNNLPIY